MPKSKSRAIFVCEQCGNESPKWEGRCHACGAWNSFVEFVPPRASSISQKSAWLSPSQNAPQELSDVSSEESERIALPMEEVNRVLGGGVVYGSVMLVAGDPGIGKSTLLLQMSDAVARNAGKVLYISGEESATQIKLRANRLGISGKALYLMGITNIDEIIDHLEAQQPVMAVVDSIQTTFTTDVTSGAGSVVQIRECARRLTQWAKATNTPVFLTGHVTKGGEVAGPRVLEHMVDVVLYLEGDPLSAYRLLRTAKNRFGSTNEVGVMEMKGDGLKEVLDPSKAFLSEYREGAIGSTIIPTVEGSRPLLVEVQALTNPSILPVPRRVANGIDFNRMIIISAVLSQRCGQSIGGQDVMVSVAGGLRIEEPAADLGVALAIASSMRRAPVKPDIVAMGEVGLTGEVRYVPQVERRMEEAARMGFKKCLVPGSFKESSAINKDVELIKVRTLSEAIRIAVPNQPKGDRQAAEAW